MNRQNFFVHLSIAVVLVILAAVAGQIRRAEWNKSAHPEVPEVVVKTSIPKPAAAVRSAADREPEVIVKFRPEVSIEQIRKIVAKNNDVIEDRIENVKNQVAIDDLDGADMYAVAAQYASMSDLVLYAEPNFQYQLDPFTAREVVMKKGPVVAGAPDDPMFGDQWALNNTGQLGGKQRADMDMLKAWETSKGSRKVVVAMLDSGIDLTHPDLVGNLWTRPDNVPPYQDKELGTINDENGFSAITHDGNVMDDNGHGTHCAGVIGAEGDNGEGIAGINWEVELMPLKVLNGFGSGDIKNSIEAINYAIDRKRHGVNIRVINASLGSTTYTKALEDVIRAANEEGILIVAAAGNSGSSNDTWPHYPSNYNLPNIISVAALDRSDLIASFSNFGSKTVHVGAPGKDIVSTWIGGGYRQLSGTSMAAPQVAGVAALLLARNPEMSVRELREKLLKSADPLDSLTGKLENAGRINAAKALAD